MSCGEKALEIYRRHKQGIDIVVLDIGLPKVAGKDVLLQMKQQKPDVKLVVASGYRARVEVLFQSGRDSTFYP